MLQIKNIHKRYKTGDLIQKALDGVSLNLRDNEFVAILGPSGSGKTTLLNIIGGLDRYDQGDLIINGISTKKYKDRDWDSYRNHTIGFVFQSYNLIPHQTVLSNVELALTISGISKAERRERAKKALEQVGLGNQGHKKPNQMSGGQMQRVAIARALVNDPDILLADEPTGALDSDTSVQVMELLKEVAKDRLVVMVTHNPELAQDYATRIVELKDGTIRSDSHPYHVSENKLDKPEHKNMGKSSMSFLTALSLSFNNLRTKKARTILTSFAGSIGIIGIALILSLSNGVNQYIQSIEEETLSEYPLQIQSTGFDMTSMMVDVQDNQNEEKQEGDIQVLQMITNMFSKIGANDLASLKQYLDESNTNIKQYTNAVEYTYNVSPQIYNTDTKEIRQVHPDQSFQSLGLGSSSSGNSMMSTMMSTDVFFEMPSDKSLYEDQYDVKAGRWPQNYNECVLVLTKSGKINDLMSYTLGLRDFDELDKMVEQFAKEEDVDEIEEYYEFASCINDVDMWFLKRDDSLKMSVLFNLMGISRMEERFLNSAYNGFTDTEKLLITLEEERRDAYIKKAMRNICTMKDKNGLTFTAVFAEGYASELGNYIISEDISDYVILINAQGKKVSLRSRKDIDIRQIAENNGGGGHKNAAGCPIKNEDFDLNNILTNMGII